MKLNTDGSTPSGVPSGYMHASIIQKDIDAHFVVASIPDDVTPGVYDVWVKNGNGWSNPIKLNASTALWISQKEAWTGQIVKVTGRNFDGKEFSASQNTKLRLVQVSNENNKIDITSSIITSGLNAVNPYCVSFTMPSSATQNTEYYVEVSNDGYNYSRTSSGQKLKRVATGSDPLNLGVSWAGTFNYTREYNVTNSPYNATANDGTDDTSAIQNCIDAIKTAGGGVVYIPSGNFRITTLKMPAGIILKGAGPDSTSLEYIASYSSQYNMIESKSDGVTNGQQGVYGLKFKLSNPESVPDFFMLLGHTGGDAAFYGRDRTAKNIFIVNTKIQQESDWTADNMGRYHDDNNVSTGRVLDTGRGHGAAITGDENVMVNNNYWVGFNASLSWTTFNQYGQMSNNYFEYAKLTTGMNATYLLVENNRCVGHKELDCNTRPGYETLGMHSGIFCRDNSYIYNNSISDVGSPTANDGETIAVEVAGNYFNCGTVTSATSNSINVTPNTSPLYQMVSDAKEYKEFSNGYMSVAITAGKGLGQIRKIASVSGNTITVHNAWNVTPDTTSKFSMSNMNNNVTVYRNRGENNEKGLYMFGNMVDNVVADNELKNAGGIFYWTSSNVSATASEIIVSYYNTVIRNLLDGLAPLSKYNGIRFAHGRSGGQGGHFNGFVNYGIEVRENVVSGDQNVMPVQWPGPGDTEESGGNGTESGIMVTTGGDYDGSGYETKNYIIEGNTIRKKAKGIYIARQTTGVLINNNKFESTVTTNTWVDSNAVNVLSFSDSNYSQGKTATASSYVAGTEPSKAVDGATTQYDSGNSKWYCTTAGDKWLKVDLGQNYTVNRWVVKNANAGKENTAWSSSSIGSLNIKDFKLQKSSDGTNWTDVDTVTGNIVLQVDRNVTPFSARYARLYITNTGSDSNARVYEFELHGGSSIPTPIPTPTPTPSGSGTIYEAESGTLANGAVTSSDTFASGGQKVGQMHNTSASITINNVNGGTGGSQTLKVQYAAGGSSTKSLYVNGVDVEQLTFPATGAWGGSAGAYTEVTTTVNLNSGTSNTIMIRNDAPDADGVDIDKLTIESLTPTIYESESGTLANGAVTSSDTFASGGQKVGQMHNTSASITTNNVNGGTGGSKTLRVRYAAGGSATKSLYVNGVDVQQLSFPATGAWGESEGAYTEITTTITLNSGTNNTIMIRNDAADADGVDIDRLSIE